MLDPIPPSLDSTYELCMDAFNLHLWKQFCDDFMRVDDLTEYVERDYKYILKPKFHEQYLPQINSTKSGKLGDLFQCLDEMNGIYEEVFGGLADKARFINLVPTTIKGGIKGMFNADGQCNVFHSQGDAIVWRRFFSSESQMKTMLDNKISNPVGNHVFDP